jgi:hypothetical protein
LVAELPAAEPDWLLAAAPEALSRNGVADPAAPEAENSFGRLGPKIIFIYDYKISNGHSNPPFVPVLEKPRSAWNKLHRAILEEVDASFARFDDVDLRGAILERANLSHADWDLL